MKITWGLILKVFGGILTTAAVVKLLFVVFSFIQVHDNTARQVQTLTDTIPHYFNRIEVRLDRLETATIDLVQKVDDGQVKQEKLQRSYINYVSKNAKTTDEILLYLQDFIYDIKKNGNPYYLIP